MTDGEDLPDPGNRYMRILLDDYAERFPAAPVPAPVYKAMALVLEAWATPSFPGAISVYCALTGACPAVLVRRIAACQSLDQHLSARLN